MSLADEFRQAQLDVCAELRRETPYNPNRFEQGIRDATGDQAVAFTRRLVVNGGLGATGSGGCASSAASIRPLRRRLSTRAPRARCDRPARGAARREHLQHTRSL